MGTNSLIFFGLLLIPLIAFLIWVIRQDKKKNYLGLFFLVLGVIIASYTIIRLDSNFLKNKQNVKPAAPKASSFK